MPQPLMLKSWSWLQWHPTPVLLPEKSRGWRSLVGYSPWDGKESDTTERLHFHFYFNCLQKVYLLLVSERYIALTCWNPSSEWSHPVVLGFFLSCLPVEPSSVVLLGPHAVHSALGSHGWLSQKLPPLTVLSFLPSAPVRSHCLYLKLADNRYRITS